MSIRVSGNAARYSTRSITSQMRCTTDGLKSRRLPAFFLKIVRATSTPYNLVDHKPIRIIYSEVPLQTQQSVGLSLLTELTEARGELFGFIASRRGRCRLGQFWFRSSTICEITFCFEIDARCRGLMNSLQRWRIIKFLANVYIYIYTHDAASFFLFFLLFFISFSLVEIILTS